jgi:hypothetical protein
MPLILLGASAERTGRSRPEHRLAAAILDKRAGDDDGQAADEGAPQ